MANKKHALALDSKMKLMGTAMQLFIEQGFSSVSVNEICQKSGLTKGAFYYHFSSKDEIYRQLLIPMLEEHIHSSYAPDPKSSVGDRLYMLAQCVFTVSQKMGRDFMGQDFIRLISCRSSNIYEENRLYTQVLTRIIKDGIKTHAFRLELDVNNHIMLFACLMSGFLVRWCAANSEDEQRIDWNELLRHEILLLTLER